MEFMEQIDEMSKKGNALLEEVKDYDEAIVLGGIATMLDEYCKLNEGASLTDYLNQVTLSSDTDEMDDGNYVTLATIHAVKGLEFRCVMLAGKTVRVVTVGQQQYFHIHAFGQQHVNASDTGFDARLVPIV